MLGRTVATRLNIVKIISYRNFQKYGPLLFLFVGILVHRGYDCMVLHVRSLTNLNSLHVCAENFNCSLDYYARHTPIKNNTILLLDSGTHFLHNSIMFNGLQNLSIVGSNNFSRDLQEPVTKIQCIGRYGIVFTHVHYLNLRNVLIENCGGNSGSFSAAACITLY